MSPESIEALSSLCSKGSEIAIVVEDDGRRTRIKGKFIKFSGDGLTVETEVSVRHLSCAAILDFEVFRNGNAAVVPAAAAAKQAADRSSVDPHMTFLSGKIALDLPTPDFSVPRFPAEYHQQLNR